MRRQIQFDKNALDIFSALLKPFTDQHVVTSQMLDIQRNKAQITVISLIAATTFEQFFKAKCDSGDTEISFTENVREQEEDAISYIVLFKANSSNDLTNLLREMMDVPGHLDMIFGIYITHLHQSLRLYFQNTTDALGHYLSEHSIENLAYIDFLFSTGKLGKTSENPIDQIKKAITTRDEQLFKRQELRAQEQERLSLAAKFYELLKDYLAEPLTWQLLCVNQSSVYPEQITVTSRDNMLIIKALESFAHNRKMDIHRSKRSCKIITFMGTQKNIDILKQIKEQDAARKEDPPFYIACIIAIYKQLLSCAIDIPTMPAEEKKLLETKRDSYNTTKIKKKEVTRQYFDIPACLAEFKELCQTSAMAWAVQAQLRASCLLEMRASRIITNPERIRTDLFGGLVVIPEEETAPTAAAAARLSPPPSP